MTLAVNDVFKKSPALDSYPLHPARHCLGMLQEKLFFFQIFGTLTAVSPSKMNTNSPQTRVSAGSDQYGSDKAGHLPGAAGQKEGL